MTVSLKKKNSLTQEIMLQNEDKKYIESRKQILETNIFPSNQKFPL